MKVCCSVRVVWHRPTCLTTWATAFTLGWVDSLTLCMLRHASRFWREVLYCLSFKKKKKLFCYIPIKNEAGSACETFCPISVPRDTQGGQTSLDKIQNWGFWWQTDVWGQSEDISLFSSLEASWFGVPLRTPCLAMQTVKWGWASVDPLAAARSLWIRNESAGQTAPVLLFHARLKRADASVNQPCSDFYPRMSPSSYGGESPPPRSASVSPGPFANRDF